MIAIEGPIAAGKTTLGTILESRLHIPLYRELGDPVTKELLLRFYAEKPRWALTLQVHFLNRRFRLVKGIMADKGRGAMDRSIFGDRLFADQLHYDGDMDDREYRVYTDLLENMLQHVVGPDLLVFLDCSVDTALERIHRRGRTSEAGISPEYLHALRERYVRWYDAYDRSAKLIINTQRHPLDDPDVARRIVSLVLSAIRR